jgi:hypothetical protein
MRQILTFLVSGLVFCAIPALAQLNTVTIGTFILPTGDFTLAHGALGYYRQTSLNQAIGIKAMMYTDEIGSKEDDILNSIVNVDLVHRWTFKKEHKRTQWNLEAGISSAWIIQKFPPVKNWGFCGTGMSTEQMLELQKYYDEVLSKWHVERDFLTGIATAASWEILLSSHFKVGMAATVNVYYSPKNSFQILPTPQVNASYIF